MEAPRFSQIPRALTTPQLKRQRKGAGTPRRILQPLADQRPDLNMISEITRAGSRDHGRLQNRPRGRDKAF
jgi:hypothetical protein